MPIRSMTGFSQVRGEVNTASPSSSSNGKLAFVLSLKSVNHRFLDLHFRLPSGTDSLEMQLRRLLKEKMARGHVEVSLSLERTSNETFAMNREIVGGYISRLPRGRRRVFHRRRARSQCDSSSSGRTRICE